MVKTAHSKAYKLRRCGRLAFGTLRQKTAATSGKQDIVRKAKLYAQDIGNGFVSRHR